MWNAERASRGNTHDIKRGVLFFSLFCLFPLIREYLHFPEFVRITFPNRYTLFTSFSPLQLLTEMNIRRFYVGIDIRLCISAISTLNSYFWMRIEYSIAVRFLLTFSRLSSFCARGARVYVYACVHEITLERIRVSLGRMYSTVEFYNEKQLVAHSNSRDLLIQDRYDRSSWKLFGEYVVVVLLTPRSCSFFLSLFLS